MEEPERIYEEVIKNEKVIGTGVKALDDLLKGKKKFNNILK